MTDIDQNGAAPAEPATTLAATTSAPAVAEAPSPAPQQPAEAPPKAALAADTPTLFETLPSETAPNVDATASSEAADAAQRASQGTEPTIEASTYTDFSFPEGFSANPEQIGQYTGILGKHRISQEAGQELVELYSTEMQRYADHLASEQQRLFSEYRQEQRNAVLSDSELGGDNYRETMAAVARMRDRLVEPGRREAFDQFLRVTGAGDHPEFLRVFYKVAQLIDEPVLPPPNPKPPSNLGQRPGNRMSDFYTNSMGGSDRQS